MCTNCGSGRMVEVDRHIAWVDADGHQVYAVTYRCTDCGTEYLSYER